MDNTNTDSSAVCTGTFASRGTFIGGNAVRLAAERVRERILDIASKELEIDASDLEIADGQVTAKGAPQKTINVADVAGAATYNYGELISGSSTALKPFADVDDATGQVEIEPHSAISYAACVAEVEVDDETGEVVVLKLVQVYDVGRAINPTLVEGQIEGGAIMGLGLGLTESSYPHYPSPEHRGGEFGAYLGPAMEDLPELDNVILENPSEDGPFGAKAIGEIDRKSTRLNSSHRCISYAVFCLKKKKEILLLVTAVLVLLFWLRVLGVSTPSSVSIKSLDTPFV